MWQGELKSKMALRLLFTDLEIGRQSFIVPVAQSSQGPCEWKRQERKSKRHDMKGTLHTTARFENEGGHSPGVRLPPEAEGKDVDSPLEPLEGCLPLSLCGSPRPDRAEGAHPASREMISRWPNLLRTHFPLRPGGEPRRGGQWCQQDWVLPLDSADQPAAQLTVQHPRLQHRGEARESHAAAAQVPGERSCCHVQWGTGWGRTSL